MQIDRFAPRSADVFCRNHIIVHIKVSCVHGIHHSIYDIEQILLLAISQARCPDSLCWRKLFQIDFFVICQYMCVQFPVLHILGMVNRDSRHPFKCWYCYIIIVPFSANARVRVKSFENRVMNHDFSSYMTRCRSLFLWHPIITLLLKSVRTFLDSKYPSAFTPSGTSQSPHIFQDPSCPIRSSLCH